jgi:signal recognition particle subunit SRP54
VFENLTGRLETTLKRLRGEARLSEANISDALREVRMALLEADVALPVVKSFIDDVRAKAVGQEVLSSLTPGQAVIKVVYDALVVLMGERNERLNLAVRPPAVVMVAGLQGSGKTTSAAKLARFLREREKKNVLLVSTDVYRPAAIDQLQRLSMQVGAQFFPSRPDQEPVDIARAALDQARVSAVDVLIVDTAGRLHVDAAMMDEIRALNAVLDPVETLFVVDSMTGQDAVNTAKAFNDALPLTGVILTKTDGDARGGAALSVRFVTGKPIKFLGIGEKIDALEPFHPERMASRILGMGDVLTLVEQAQRTVDQEKAQELARKVAKGSGFDLLDFRDQLLQMEKMGGMSSMLDKLPGMGQAPSAEQIAQGEKQLRRTVAVINSMTPEERRKPDIIRGSRKRRIAAGSGTQVQDVNRLLKQFMEMQSMMKRLGKGGMQKMLRGLKGRFPGMPF